MAQSKKQVHSRIQSVIDLYYDQIKASEKYWDRDSQVSDVQISQILQTKPLGCHHNTKIYKSLFGTVSILQKKNQSDQQIQQENYYSSQATVIQRYYRGFQKRKYFHDYYARKQYLTFLKNKNDQFKLDLDRNAIFERNEEDSRKELCAREEFMHLAQNLHHLTSTAQQPGIFRPPFAPVHPKVFDIEVETHIKEAFKTNYKWKPPQSAVQRTHSVSNPQQTSYIIRPGTQQVKRVK